VPHRTRCRPDGM